MAFGLSAGTIASIAGAGMGLLSSKDKSGNTTTAKQEPWAPAQQYLIDNLATNKKLQDYYAQNPFNSLQQQGYQNLYGDANNLRQNVAPGLMDFANNMMGSQYTRTAPQRAGGGAGYGGQPQQSTARQTGLLGPFSVQQQTPYQVGNLNQQNPLYTAPQTPEQQQAAALAEQERQRQLALQQQAPRAWSASDNSTVL